jgi:hypothetical protein
MLPSSCGLSLPSKYQLQVFRMSAWGSLDLEFTQSGCGPRLIDQACQQNVRSLLPTTQILVLVFESIFLILHLSSTEVSSLSPQFKVDGVAKFSFRMSLSLYSNLLSASC